MAPTVSIQSTRTLLDSIATGATSTQSSWQSSAQEDPGIEDNLTDAGTDDDAPVSPPSEITFDDEQIETHRFNLELDKGDRSKLSESGKSYSFHRVHL